MIELPFNEALFSVIDLETSGFSPENNSIIEIGIQQIEHLKLTKTYNSFVYTDDPIELNITKKTGITNEMLMSEPLIEELEPNICKFIQESIIVEHSRNDFDLNFLKNSINCLNKVYHVNTCFLSRELYPNSEENYDLATIASNLNIKNRFPHHALDDAKTCALILLEIIEDLSNLSLKCLKDLNEAFKIPILK